MAGCPPARCPFLRSLLTEITPSRSLSSSPVTSRTRRRSARGKSARPWNTFAHPAPAAGVSAFPARRPSRGNCSSARHTGIGTRSRGLPLRRISLDSGLLDPRPDDLRTARVTGLHVRVRNTVAASGCEESDVGHLSSPRPAIVVRHETSLDIFHVFLSFLRPRRKRRDALARTQPPPSRLQLSRVPARARRLSLPPAPASLLRRRPGTDPNLPRDSSPPLISNRPRRPPGASSSSSAASARETRQRGRMR